MDTFIQGADDDENLLIFDNEMPPFKCKVDYFNISNILHRLSIFTIRKVTRI